MYKLDPIASVVRYLELTTSERFESSVFIRIYKEIDLVKKQVPYLGKVKY